MQAVQDLRAGVKGLLENAFSKVGDRAYVIFIDLNLPHFPGQPTDKPWFSELKQTIEDLDHENPECHPYNMLVFSNTPHHYGSDDEPDPPRDFLHVISTKPRKWLRGGVLDAITIAIDQYGNVPNTFP